jgi:ABC-type Na+ transport system ATPase subunit NatA
VPIVKVYANYRPDGTSAVAWGNVEGEVGLRRLVYLTTLCLRLVARSWMPAACDLPDFMTVDEAWQMMAALRGAPRWDAAPLREALGLPGRLRLSACSAGQRKKASLLAALAGDPGVLLLDEPLATVDAQAAETLSAWLEGWRSARVVVLASHEALPLSVDSTATLAAGVPLQWAHA